MLDLPSPLQSEKSANVLADELLCAITQEDAIYPWNPADPEAESYFAELEQNFSLTDCLNDEEIETQANAFFEQIHQCWDGNHASDSDSP